MSKNKKRINSKLYSAVKYVYENHKYVYVTSKEGYLFSNLIYPTKITKEDLPPSFIELYAYRRYCWIDSAGVTDMVYVPNLFFNNHLYKDDFLYIKYGGQLDRSKKNKYFDDADERIYGRGIELFVEAAKKYSNYDASKIEKQLRDKKIWYVKHNPTHPELGNNEIDFDVPIRFCYRTDENAPCSKEQQKESMLQFCEEHKLVPVDTDLTYTGLNDLKALVENVNKLKNGQDDFIVLFLRHPKRDDQDTLNAIWRELWRIDVPLEDFHYWEREE